MSHCGEFAPIFCHFGDTSRFFVELVEAGGICGEGGGPCARAEGGWHG